MLVAIALFASCRRPSTVTPDARTNTIAARDASVPIVHTQSSPAITASAALPTSEQPSVTACGALSIRCIGPRGASSSLCHWGLRFDGENTPGVWLGPHPPWPGAETGVAPRDVDFREENPPRMCATGRFYPEFPLAPGDPPYASRFSGKWIFATSIVREPAARSTTATTATVAERWSTRWRIDAHFVAQIGDRLLVRADRTSDEGTYTLYDARTGASLQSVPWLSNALPLGQRTYTHRFTFAGRYVSVVQGEPADRTAVFELASGIERFHVRSPDTAVLATLDGDDTVAVIVARDRRGRAEVRCADAATGRVRWASATSRPAAVVIATSRSAFLVFEYAQRDAVREGTLVWRDARTGRVRWSVALRDSPPEPVRVVWSSESAWISQGTTLIVGDERGERARWTTEQRIDDLRVASGTAVVAMVGDRLAGYSEGARSPRWTQSIAAGCVHGGGRFAFVVVGDALWRELDPATGNGLFELGGGHCHWQLNVLPVSHDENAVLMTWPSRIELRQRTDSLVARNALRVTGRVTLDGRPLAGVSVRLGAQTTHTDSSGRFVFELLPEGEFVLRVNEALDRFAPGRCVSAEPSNNVIVHGREGGTRDVELRMRTYEPNPLTRCSPM